MWSRGKAQRGNGEKSPQEEGRKRRISMCLLRAGALSPQPHSMAMCRADHPPARRSLDGGRFTASRARLLLYLVTLN